MRMNLLACFGVCVLYKIWDLGGLRLQHTIELCQDYLEHHLACMPSFDFSLISERGWKSIG